MSWARSLERLDVAWKGESLQELAITPLTRLTQLRLEMFNLGPDDRPFEAVAGAVFASQLRRLHIDQSPEVQPGQMAGLQLPYLETLNIYCYCPFPHPDASLNMWFVPRLQSLKVDGGLINEAAAAALASFRLRALTRLRIACPEIPPVAMATLFAPTTRWLTQLRSLKVRHPREGDAPLMWRALAAAPLTNLRELGIGDCSTLDAAGAAELAKAPWLRGLEGFWCRNLPDACAAVLRAGSGGYAELSAAGRIHFY